MLPTKTDIINLLKNNDRAIGRALIVLNNNQTFDEQAQGATVHHNGMGFKPCHAEIGTSMANFFQTAGFLTPKQIQFWRKPAKNGEPRIACYHRQLIEAARAKVAQNA